MLRTAIAAFVVVTLSACSHVEQASDVAASSGNAGASDFSGSISVNVDPSKTISAMKAMSQTSEADAVSNDTVAFQAPGGVTPSGTGERYFFTMFGFQKTGPFNLPRFTHSWLQVIRVYGTDLQTSPIETFTISWDAADGDIGIEQFVEAGHNYTQEETMQMAVELGVSVRRSQIKEINAAFYNKIVAQSNKLDNGEWTSTIRYRMTDDFTNRYNVINNVPGAYLNCQHAVTDVLKAAGNQLIDTGLKRGWAASDQIFAWYMSSPYILNKNVAFDSVLAPRVGI